MNREGNIYTIVFSSIMVTIVGGLLAYVAMSLREPQEGNIKNEKMRNILQAIDPSFVGSELAAMSRSEVEALFKEHVKKRVTIDYNGNVIKEYTSEDPFSKEEKDYDAFYLNPRKLYADIVGIKKSCEGDPACIEKKMMEQKIYSPMFICENKGQIVYVAHFSGKGLWDDIWGYMGIKPSRKINASVFDHKGETPGLGSKITEDWFQDQYIGKTMANDKDQYKPIKVLKPGLEVNEYQVNGISGATFTGAGVDEMMGRALQATHAYMTKNVPVAEDSYSGEAVTYSLPYTIENLKGEWKGASSTWTIDGTYSIQGDTLSSVGSEGTTRIVYVDDHKLLVKRSNEEFVASYSK